MRCTVCPRVLVALAMTAAMAITAWGQEQQRYSGLVVSVAPDAHTITVEEMGPWTGPDTAPQRQIVTLTSQTRIELASRSETASITGGWPGDFRTSTLEVTDLRPGDFATVTATKAGRDILASSIAVVRPSGDRPRLSESRARPGSQGR
jgi:hypothetical protein